MRGSCFGITHAMPQIFRHSCVNGLMSIYVSVSFSSSALRNVEPSAYNVVLVFSSLNLKRQLFIPISLLELKGVPQRLQNAGR